jgi:hypothetical protein
MTDGHQSMAPIFLARGRLEVIAAFGVDSVDDLPHGLLVILGEVDSPLLQDVQHPLAGLGTSLIWQLLGFFIR